MSKLSDLVFTNIRTATIRQSLVTTVSTIGNGAFGALFYLYSARQLGATNYGLFTLGVATVAVLAVIFDFGTDKGMVRFLPRFAPGSSESNQILKATLLIKILSGLVITLLSITFASELARGIFNQPLMANYLPAIGLGFFSQLLFFFATNYFLSQEKFFAWGGLFVGANALRFVLSIVLGLWGYFDINSAFLLYITTPLISFFIALHHIGLKFLKCRITSSTFHQILSFNKWSFGFSSVSAVGSRLDTYLSARFLDLASLGVYGLAGQATILLPNLISALGAVTGPKFSRFRNPGENSRYLKKTMIFFSAISLLSGLIIYPIGILFMVYSGPQYLAGAIPLALLLISQMIFLAMSPLRDSLLYFHSRPDLFFFIGLGHVAINIISGVTLIPILGLVGASASNLIGQVFLSLCVAFFYRRISVKSA